MLLTPHPSQNSPITVKNKGLWMNGKVRLFEGARLPRSLLTPRVRPRQDLPLAAKFYELEYKHPESFPVNTIHCMRVLRAVEDKLPDRLEKATELFFVSLSSASLPWPLSTRGVTV